MERAIVVHASTQQDAVLATQVLGSVGIQTIVCATGDELLAQLGRGAGALLVVEEAIAGPYLGPLRDFIAAQPAWSDLPVLVLTLRGSDSLAAQRAVESLGNVTLLERPVRTMALITAVRSALRARDRQYQVRQAEQRKDEFLATLAHELRNPLAPMRTATYILQQRRAQEDVGKLADVLDRQVTHLTRLVEDLLDVARISNGKVNLQLGDTGAAAIAMQAVEIARPAVDARHHVLQVDVPAQDVALHVDRVRIVQSVANLLLNAAKFTPEGGRISLEVAADAQSVAFTVRDNGRGIAPEALDSIFALFSQAPSQGEQASGLGIGLSLAYGFTRMHGGTLTVASDGPGTGSAFTLRLPREAATGRP